MKAKKPNPTITLAAQVLRRRVLLTDAALTRPGAYTSDAAYTQEIRAALRLYVRTWVLPIIDALEDGNTAELKALCEGERTMHKEQAL